MALLKRLKATTLMETLTAVLIVVLVFGIASLSLQNIYGAEVKNNDDVLRNRLKELKYQAQHNNLTYPFMEDNDKWNIYIENKTSNKVVTINWKKGQETTVENWKIEE